MGDSPVKLINFGVLDKENAPIDAPVAVEALDIKKPLVEVVKEEKPVEKPIAAVVAPTIKESEADEPLLRENAHRFVLFPIKFHEVRQ